MARYSAEKDMLHRLKVAKKKGIGQKKHNAQKKFKNSGGNPEKIYSYNAYRTYTTGIKKFGEFQKAAGVKIGSADDVKAARQDFVNWLIAEGKSASTIHTYVAAVNSALGLQNDSSVKVPTRHMGDFKQNRSTLTEYSKHFSESRHADLALVCRCTGCRRADLLGNDHKAALTGAALTVNRHGKPAVEFKNSKGGRNRISEIAGTPEEVSRVVEIFKAAGEKEVFKTIEPDGFSASNAPIHQWRSDYAWKIYNSYTRDTSDLSRSELYKCENDRYGETFDKEALKEVNYNLGHAETRYTEAVRNYLYHRQ